MDIKQIKKYIDYVAEATEVLAEMMLWDLEEEFGEGAVPLVLDIREPYEMEMGYANVRSLKTGLRGWNDYEMPLVRREGEEPVLETNADRYFAPNVRNDQLKSKS